ncbi:xylulokinase [Jeotgalibacillus sp. ET6]|uniref:xylulokinase n=1 Tax=Jeotgalibacillus sp. ET6 TaxID=3037260 RepID=UPI0024186380|nr:xylulokinase [Jeotgalibacillus sp. ET6]MDG5471853.1 xylulokinase [Jeotgalibacillus sp. ET6]
MNCVLGIDLGTSAVKILLINQTGEVVKEVSKSYPLVHSKPGWSEQDPEEWVQKTIEGISEITADFKEVSKIQGMSFSGQMHGLVLLGENNEVLRNAILWNDVRTTSQCRNIEDKVGKEKLLEITKNPALEGFTLPKLLWVKENETELYEQAHKFVLPKDYLRYRLTNQLHAEYSDAAGTLLLDIAKKEWSSEIAQIMGIDLSLCPDLVESAALVGTITEETAQLTGLAESTKVFAGGADNACGAIGAGILKDGLTMCSIGTSGVVLSYEASSDKEFGGKVHYFNHGKEDSFYTMGVTLSAGHSLTWFRETFAVDHSFDELLEEAKSVPPGANGLLFTPYLSGERTPHADADIRASFIGMSTSHQQKDFTRSVLEGITFSLNESIEIFRSEGKNINKIISIGGAAKSPVWLQMQADIFDAEVIRLSSEQGPGMGAAMLAALGCGWFQSLEDCAEEFLRESAVYQPVTEHAAQYKEIFSIYKKVYDQTRDLNKALASLRSAGTNS